MISITGKLYNIATTQSTDRETGEVLNTSTAEILHTSRGKTELAALKLDPSIVESWSKVIGKDISTEVRFYAMKNREGGIQSGLTLADKKALPVLAVPLKAAA